MWCLKSSQHPGFGLIPTTWHLKKGVFDCRFHLAVHQANQNYKSIPISIFRQPILGESRGKSVFRHPLYRVLLEANVLTLSGWIPTLDQQKQWILLDHFGRGLSPGFLSTHLAWRVCIMILFCGILITWTQYKNYALSLRRISSSIKWGGGEGTPVSLNYRPWRVTLQQQTVWLLIFYDLTLPVITKYSSP